MTRDHVTELLSPYLDDQVNPAERDRITRHLDACDACRKYLGSLREVVELIGSVTPVAAPESFRSRVRGRIEEARRSGTAMWWAHFSGNWRTLAGAAAVGLVVVFAANLLGPQLARHSVGIPRPADEQVAPAGKASVPFNTATRGGPAAQQPAAPPASSLALPPAAPPMAGQPPEPFPRSVVRTAHLAIEVEKFDAGARRLLEIAEGAGGFIADSSSADDEGNPQGEFTLRVPAPQFSAVIQDVEGLGTVTERRFSAQDVTEEFVDLQARLRNLERQEQQLLTFMDRAARISDLLAIEQELSRVRGQIEQITGRMHFLEHNVDLATVNVAMRQKAIAKSVGLWDFGATLVKMQAAFVATVRQILGGVQWVAVLASTLSPALIIAGVVWVLFRRFRRPGAGA